MLVEKTGSSEHPHRLALRNAFIACKVGLFPSRYRQAYLLTTLSTLTFTILYVYRPRVSKCSCTEQSACMDQPVQQLKSPPGTVAAVC